MQPPVCLKRVNHPSIHQRAADTKEKHQKEANSYCKSSSFLGDGLGHALPPWLALRGEAMVEF
jgi:hypothetical protein